MGRQDSPERLIEKARSGHTGAQQDLWRAHRRWVAAIILAHRPHAVDVDDLMQDVALKFVSKIPTLREVAAFRPWLRQIVLNVCRGEARNLKPMLHIAQSEAGEDGLPEAGLVSQPASVHATSDEIIDTNDAARRLMDQVLTLPPEYREPLLLRCVRALTYQQISEILDLPVTTIETRLARARRMLRAEIGDEVFAEEGS